MYNDRKLSKNGCNSAGVDDSAVPMKLSRSCLGAAGGSIAIAAVDVEDDILSPENKITTGGNDAGRRVGGSLHVLAVVCLFLWMLRMLIEDLGKVS